MSDPFTIVWDASGLRFPLPVGVPVPWWAKGPLFRRWLRSFPEEAFYRCTTDEQETE